MARILVTGGAGYIGSHVCKALAAAGFEPVVLDNLVTGDRRAVRWGRLLEIDLVDGDAVRRALERERPLGVIHMAASTDVGESMADPGRYYRNNLFGGLNLLDAMVAIGVGILVFSSTGAVYGAVQRIPVSEDDPTAPINPYGETKLAFEQALKSHGAAHGLRWAALRYFNAAGADPDGEAGDSRRPERNLVPIVLSACLGWRTPLTIFGTDFATADGTALRDYIHVTDLAAAHVATLRRLLDGGDGLVLNLGTGTGHSVRQVVAEATRVTGVAPPIVLGARRRGDPPAVVADPARAFRTLDWRPALSDLPTIIETAYRWHRERGR